MNPYALLQEYQLKRDVWTRDEVAKMLITLQKSKDYLHNIHGEWMKSRDMLILIMMFEQSCRPREITNIKFKDIDLSKRTLFIDENNNKTRKSRLIPMCERVLPFLEKYLSFPKWLWNSSIYLFPSFENKNTHLSSGRWKHIFREKICKPAGFWKDPDIPSKSRTSSYCLRHSRATELLEKTGDLDLVAHFLGHADYRITKSYLHFTKTRWEKLSNSINDI